MDDALKGEVVLLLRDYMYVGVWVDSVPMFAFDRNTPREEIEQLFDTYVKGTNCWMDGTNDIGELSGQDNEDTYC